MPDSGCPVVADTIGINQRIRECGVVETEANTIETVVGDAIAGRSSGDNQHIGGLSSDNRRKWLSDHITCRERDGRGAWSRPGGISSRIDCHINSTDESGRLGVGVHINIPIERLARVERIEGQRECGRIVNLPTTWVGNSSQVRERHDTGHHWLSVNTRQPGRSGVSNDSGVRIEGERYARINRVVEVIGRCQVNQEAGNTDARR